MTRRVLWHKLLITDLKSYKLKKNHKPVNYNIFTIIIKMEYFYYFNMLVPLVGFPLS